MLTSDYCFLFVPFLQGTRVSVCVCAHCLPLCVCVHTHTPCPWPLLGSARHLLSQVSKFDLLPFCLAVISGRDFLECVAFLDFSRIQYLPFTVVPCSPCGAPNKAQTPLPCRCLCAPAVPRRRYLQNQTGAHLPNTRQNHSADSLPERSAMSIAGTKQENWQLQFKGPELPHGFQRRAFLFFSKSHLCIAMACRILVLQPGIEPTPSPVTARSPHHWTVGSSRGKGL